MNVALPCIWKLDASPPGALELVGEPLDVLLEWDVLPIRIFSPVKLDTVLLVGVFSECASNVCNVNAGFMGSSQ